MVVVSRAVFMPLAWIANWLLSDATSGAFTGGFLRIWRHWDGALLLQISEFGYTTRGDPHAAAFFPLFPMLVRALTWIGIDRLLAGMLISAVSCVVAFAFLYRLAEEDIGPGAGRRAVLYLALFPTAVFLIAPYTEALFLAGAIPAFYYARRGRWFHVAIPAAVAMGARFAGVFVLAGLAIEFVRRREWSKWRRALLALTAGVSPLIGFMAFLHFQYGDALAFVQAQKDGWLRAFVWPWDAFSTTLHAGGAHSQTNWNATWRIEIFAAAFGVAATIWLVAKREWGYAMFAALTMAVLLCSSWYYSIPRMLLALFPIVLLLAGAAQKRARTHEWILMVFAPIATLGVIVFTRGPWFF